MSGPLYQQIPCEEVTQRQFHYHQMRSHIAAISITKEHEIKHTNCGAHDLHINAADIVAICYTACLPCPTNRLANSEKLISREIQLFSHSLFSCGPLFLVSVCLQTEEANFEDVEHVPEIRACHI
jgi:ferredoxin-like protein FixX